MKLRIKAENVDLPPDLRSSIDDRFRITLGNRASRDQNVTIVVSRAGEAGDQIRCRISLRHDDAASERIEEVAQDLSTALDWAIWRLVHSLDRRALRTARAGQRPFHPAAQGISERRPK